MPARNRSGFDNTKTTSAEGAEAVTPADAVDLTFITRAIWVGGAGNLAVTMLSGDVVTFVGVAAGTMLAIRCTRVMATNTTATNILGLS